MHSCDLYSNLIRGCCCCDNGLSLRAGAQPGAGVDAQRMLNKGALQRMVIYLGLEHGQLCVVTLYVTLCDIVTTVYTVDVNMTYMYMCFFLSSFSSLI